MLCESQQTYSLKYGVDPWHGSVVQKSDLHKEDM